MYEQALSSIPEEVFLPGNLVYGSRFGDLTWESFVKTGIQSGKATQRQVTSPEDICFSLLSKSELPGRYNHACHLGPIAGTFLDSHKVGIIVDKEAVLQAYPTELFAVGENFTDLKQHHLNRYDFKENPETVFGIPILRGYLPQFVSRLFSAPLSIYEDEVRIIPSDRRIVNVSVGMWRGLVLGSEYYANFMLRISQKIRELDGMPLFSTDCEFLERIKVTTRSYRKVKKYKP